MPTVGLALNSAATFSMSSPRFGTTVSAFGNGLVGSWLTSSGCFCLISWSAFAFDTKTTSLTSGLEVAIRATASI